ncbi:hypothetical protein CHUAL_008321 [Chamberlinius hualienensis]
MKLQRSNTLLSAVFCLLFAVCSGSLAPKAAPSGSVCCTFETYDCVSTNTAWTLSATLSPPIPPPLPGNNFLWTETAGATAYFPIISVNVPSSAFTLKFYIDSPPAELLISFYRVSDGKSVLLGNLNYGPGVWNSVLIPCANCCDSIGNCFGQLKIEARELGGTIVAIDDVYIDGNCF